MITSALINTVIVLFYVVLGLLFISNVYEIVLLWFVRRAYDRHDPCAFFIPFYPLVTRPFRDLAVPQYLASVAIQRGDIPVQRHTAVEEVKEMNHSPSKSSSTEPGSTTDGQDVLVDDVFARADSLGSKSSANFAKKLPFFGDSVSHSASSGGGGTAAKQQDHTPGLSSSQVATATMNSPSAEAFSSTTGAVAAKASNRKQKEESATMRRIAALPAALNWYLSHGNANVNVGDRGRVPVWGLIMPVELAKEKALQQQSSPRRPAAASSSLSLSATAHAKAAVPHVILKQKRMKAEIIAKSGEAGPDSLLAAPAMTEALPTTLQALNELIIAQEAAKIGAECALKGKGRRDARRAAAFLSAISASGGAVSKEAIDEAMASLQRTSSSSFSSAASRNQRSARAGKQPTDIKFESSGRQASSTQRHVVDSSHASNPRSGGGASGGTHGSLSGNMSIGNARSTQKEALVRMLQGALERIAQLRAVRPQYGTLLMGTTLMAERRSVRSHVTQHATVLARTRVIAHGARRSKLLLRDETRAVMAPGGSTGGPLVMHEGWQLWQAPSFSHQMHEKDDSEEEDNAFGRDDVHNLSATATVAAARAGSMNTVDDVLVSPWLSPSAQDATREFLAGKHALHHREANLQHLKQASDSGNSSSNVNTVSGAGDAATTGLSFSFSPFFPSCADQRANSRSHLRGDTIAGVSFFPPSSPPPQPDSSLTETPPPPAAAARRVRANAAVMPASGDCASWKISPTFHVIGSSPRVDGVEPVKGVDDSYLVGGTARGMSQQQQHDHARMRAEELRLAFIIGADRASLLRSITVDATRTFSHDTLNFACFYTAEDELRCVRRRMEKLDRQHRMELQLRQQLQDQQSQQQQRMFFSGEEEGLTMPVDHHGVSGNPAMISDEIANSYNCFLVAVAHQNADPSTGSLAVSSCGPPGTKKARRPLLSLESRSTPPQSSDSGIRLSPPKLQLDEASTERESNHSNNNNSIILDGDVKPIANDSNSAIASSSCSSPSPLAFSLASEEVNVAPSTVRAHATKRKTDVDVDSLVAIANIAVTAAATSLSLAAHQLLSSTTGTSFNFSLSGTLPNAESVRAQRLSSWVAPVNHRSSNSSVHGQSCCSSLDTNTSSLYSKKDAPTDGNAKPQATTTTTTIAHADNDKSETSDGTDTHQYTNVKGKVHMPVTMANASRSFETLAGLSAAMLSTAEITDEGVFATVMSSSDNGGGEDREGLDISAGNCNVRKQVSRTTAWKHSRGLSSCSELDDCGEEDGDDLLSASRLASSGTFTPRKTVLVSSSASSVAQASNAGETEQQPMKATQERQEIGGRAKAARRPLSSPTTQVEEQTQNACQVITAMNSRTTFNKRATSTITTTSTAVDSSDAHVSLKPSKGSCVPQNLPGGVSALKKTTLKKKTCVAANRTKEDKQNASEDDDDDEIGAYAATLGVSLPKQMYMVSNAYESKAVLTSTSSSTGHLKTKQRRPGAAPRVQRVAEGPGEVEVSELAIDALRNRLEKYVSSDSSSSSDGDGCSDDQDGEYNSRFNRDAGRALNKFDRRRGRGLARFGEDDARGNSGGGPTTSVRIDDIHCKRTPHGSNGRHDMEKSHRRHTRGRKGRSDRYNRRRQRDTTLQRQRQRRRRRSREAQARAQRRRQLRRRVMRDAFAADLPVALAVLLFVPAPPPLVSQWKAAWEECQSLCSSPAARALQRQQHQRVKSKEREGDEPAAVEVQNSELREGNSCEEKNGGCVANAGCSSKEMARSRCGSRESSLAGVNSNTDIETSNCFHPPTICVTLLYGATSVAVATAITNARENACGRGGDALLPFFPSSGAGAATATATASTAALDISNTLTDTSRHTLRGTQRGSSRLGERQLSSTCVRLGSQSSSATIFSVPPPLARTSTAANLLSLPSPDENPHGDAAPLFFPIDALSSSPPRYPTPQKPKHDGASFFSLPDTSQHSHLSQQVGTQSEERKDAVVSSTTTAAHRQLRERNSTQLLSRYEEFSSPLLAVNNATLSPVVGATTAAMASPSERRANGGTGMQKDNASSVFPLQAEICVFSDNDSEPSVGTASNLRLHSFDSSSDGDTMLNSSDSFSGYERKNNPERKSDVLASVCDAKHYPEGLAIPVTLMYARIGDELYAVTEVRDKTFIQFREQRVRVAAPLESTSIATREDETDKDSGEETLSNMSFGGNTSTLSSTISESERQQAQQGATYKRRTRRSAVSMLDFGETTYSLTGTADLRPGTRRQLVHMCLQCLSAEAAVVFVPCGHFAVCAACAEECASCCVCSTVILSTVTLT